jgi:hypothetical protein
MSIYRRKGSRWGHCMDYLYRSRYFITIDILIVPDLTQLKDSFQVKGTQATIGYIAFLAQPPSSTNSPLIDLLLAAGAVFYCKTNLPQTMMTADSDNNVYGRTLNPKNLSLTPGGSTGGEGALIAMRGSILGEHSRGTDTTLEILPNRIFSYRHGHRHRGKL